MAKAVAKKSDASQQVAPAFMQGKAGAGKENITTDDVEIPRLFILHGVPEHLELGEPGDFFHNVAEITLGKEISIIPILVTTELILWRPQWDGGGILARSKDMKTWDKPGKETIRPYKEAKEKDKVTWEWGESVAQSGLAEWGSHDPEDKDSPPAATKIINILCHLPDYPQLSPCVFSCQRSSMKAGKKFNGKLLAIEAPSFGIKFKVTTDKTENSEGQTYLVPKFMADGFVEDEILFHKLESQWENFREGYEIKDLDEETVVAEDTEPEAHPDAPKY